MEEKIYFSITLLTILIMCGQIAISPQYAKAKNNNLVVYYAFNEAQGTTATDSSGNNYHGSIIRASRVEGKSGGGLLFGADDARVGVAEFLDFNDGSITIEAWIKPYKIETGETYRIIGDYDYSGPYFQIRDGRLEVCHDGLSYHHGTTTIPVGVWTHIIFTSDGRYITTYLNYVLDKRSSITFPIRTIGNVHLGAHWIYVGGSSLFDYVEEFPGIIDEFKIWDSSYTSWPVISGTPRPVTQSNKLYSFTPTASDPENGPITFSIEGKPSWATFNSNTGRLYGTPTTADIGLFGPITITVQDQDWDINSLSPFTLRVILDGLSLPGVHILLQNE